MMMILEAARLDVRGITLAAEGDGEKEENKSCVCARPECEKTKMWTKGQVTSMLECQRSLGLGLACGGCVMAQVRLPDVGIVPFE
jgi:hypothetical protein